MPPPEVRLFHTPAAIKLKCGCVSSCFTHIHPPPPTSSCLLPHFLSVTRTKPGYCPRVLKVIPLHKGCVCDDDCPGNHKCCSVERRDVCVPPAFSMCHWLEICLPKFGRNLKSCFATAAAVVDVVWPHCKCFRCLRKAGAVSTRSLGLGSVCRALLRWQRLSREGEVLLQWMWTPVHCTFHRFGKQADLYAVTLVDRSGENRRKKNYGYVFEKNALASTENLQNEFLQNV